VTIGRIVRVAALATLVGVVFQNASADETKGPRRTETLVTGWRFAPGDHRGAELPDFDDSNWDPVELPHDWAIAGPFDAKADGNTGKLPWKGVGWYRLAFEPGHVPKNRAVWLEFDGVMAEPQVFINGKKAGGWDYGYMSFRVDASAHWKADARNAVAVRADTSRHGSRWYPGAGIYRDVRLVVADPVHLEPGGVILVTPKITDESATVAVSARVVNAENAKAVVDVVVRLLDATNAAVSETRIKGMELTETDGVAAASLKLPNPKRWDVTAPNLYSAEISIYRGGALIDQTTTRFGVRSFKFTADDGFHLNGRRLQLQGVCLHHDLGPVGAAFTRDAAERQLRIMKEMGVNAVRTSHNPPAPGLLDLCDELGLVVIDEMFDKWDATADRHDEAFEPFFTRQAKALIDRDRNHPSIVAWSIGNEIGDIQTGKDPEAEKKVRFAVDAVHRLDPTRPATMASNIPQAVKPGSNVLAALDIQGWNYGGKYAQAKRRFPDQPTIYTESASAFSTRGWYQFPHPKGKTDFPAAHQTTSYDRNAADWSDIPDVEFRRMERDRYCSGEFVWTGFDYLGEPTPFAQEARSSYFGIVDLVGLPKDRYWLYRSHWRPDALTVHITPHWTWPDRVGRNVPVYVYTNGDSAELFVNGKSQGVRKKATTDGPGYYGSVDRYRLRWEDVTYQPGKVEVIAYNKEGKEIGRASRSTAGPAGSLKLTADRAKLKIGTGGLAFVTIEAVDANAEVCPTEARSVTLKVEGPGVLAGADAGDPLNLEAFPGPTHTLLGGRLVAVVRARTGATGSTSTPITLTATAEGLPPATLELRVDEDASQP
jgi:beta-galactosidase